jgi:hypothetical protein
VRGQRGQGPEVPIEGSEGMAGAGWVPFLVRSVHPSSAGVSHWVKMRGAGVILGAWKPHSRMWNRPVLSGDFLFCAALFLVTEEPVWVRHHPDA